MTFRREPPPPPKSDPPSVLLMRAIGDLQTMEGGEPITDTDAIALMCGMVWVELASLIEVGITAGGRPLGSIEDDDMGGIGLSAKGQRWYDRRVPFGRHAQARIVSCEDR